MQVAELCKQKGAGEVEVAPVDLSDSAQVDKFAEKVLKDHGTVDVLVNNAAILGPISYEGDAKKNPNMGQGPIDGEQGSHKCCLAVMSTHACSKLCTFYTLLPQTKCAALAYTQPRTQLTPSFTTQLTSSLTIKVKHNQGCLLQ